MDKYKDEPKVVVPVLFKKMFPDVTIPERKTPGASGLDVKYYSETKEDCIIEPGDVKLLKTGLSVAVQKGYEVQVRSRSGLAIKENIFVLNAPGTIDSDYRGTIGVVLANFGAGAYTIKHGDRIAQLVVSAIPEIIIHEVDTLPETDRGDGGYGSTGR